MAINHLPLTELDKYSREADELASRLEQLATFHEHRAGLAREAEALKATRDRLNQSILDAEGPAEVLAENLRGLETERLVLEASSAALAPRIDAAEKALHERVPLACLCFGRLHGRVVTYVRAEAEARLRSLLDPSFQVDQEHLNALIIVMPAFVEITRIQIPSLSFAFTRPLEPEASWSSLTRPFTEPEKRAYRTETIESLISASKGLCEAARAILAAAEPYAQREFPPFRCEPEVVEPAVVDPEFLEWQQPLGGSDEQFAKEVCATAGKVYPPQSEADQRILAEMIQARHQMPIAYGTVGGEMFGSTQPA